MNTAALNLIYAGMPDRPDDSVEIMHFWGAGNYVRASVILKGKAMRFHVHEYEHRSIVVAGSGRLMTEDAIIPMKAGDSAITPAGARHAFMADADTIWLCVHPDTGDEVRKTYGVPS